jgi:hypothetical protein
MHDIVVTDIPQEHYDWICEEAAKLGISGDDYLTIMVKGYAIGLGARKRDENETPA